MVAEQEGGIRVQARGPGLTLCYCLTLPPLSLPHLRSQYLTLMKWFGAIERIVRILIYDKEELKIQIRSA